MKESIHTTNAKSIRRGRALLQMRGCTRQQQTVIDRFAMLYETAHSNSPAAFDYTATRVDGSSGIRLLRGDLIVWAMRELASIRQCLDDDDYIVLVACAVQGSSIRAIASKMGGSFSRQQDRISKSLHRAIATLDAFWNRQ